MLKIRLARVGKKNYATFRVIISDHTKSPKAEAMEILGSFDPNLEPAVLKLNEDRVKYWLSKGVGYSDTVGDMLAKKGWIKKERIKYTSKHPKKNKEQLAKEKAAATEAAKKAKTAPAPSSGEGAKKEEKKEAPKAEAKKEVPKPAEKPAAKKEAPKPEDKKPEAKK
jgi:small subunit ribosomal protein S16